MSRAFIIGNGPSLTIEQLEAASNYPTFSLNRIHLLPGYATSDWRPTHWGLFDVSSGWQEWAIKQQINKGRNCFIRADLAGMVEHSHLTVPRWPQNVTYLRLCTAHAGMDITSPHKPKKWHLPELCRFGSGLFTMAQIAMLMGYDELWLLGCDLGFSDPDKPDHFSEVYPTEDDHDIEKRDATLRYGHIMTRHLADKRGVKMINASAGEGLKDIYERKSWPQ